MDFVNIHLVKREENYEINILVLEKKIAMRKSYTPGALLIILFFISACQKESSLTPGSPRQKTKNSSFRNKPAALAANTIENFETGTKTSYASADINLSTGSWNLNDALIGNTASDKKNGTQCTRVRNSGILTTNFDFTGGASSVTIYHALYGTDASGTWQLWYSTNGGISYVQSGTTTTSTSTLQAANFVVNIAGNIRFQIRKTDGSANRINFDDFTVVPFSGTPPNPTLSSVSPNSVYAGSTSFSITATGTNFTSTSSITWNGTSRTSRACRHICHL